MKYLPLVWYGIWRKRGRTVLILIQIAMAFLLFGLMQGIKSGVDDAVNKLSADLFVVQRANGNVPLPIAMYERIKAVSGVKNVTYQALIPGTYQKPTQRVVAVATDVEDAREFPAGANISPDIVAAMQHTRNGAIASRNLADKYGWKVGQQIPLEVPPALRSAGNQWTFDLLAVVDPGDKMINKEVLVINYAYFDEARIVGKGTVSIFLIKVSDVKTGTAVAQAIDQLFTNSSDETRTEAMKDLVQDNLKAIGDLDFIIRSVVGAVLFALLFSVGAMMMQSIRERTPELAVLKTVGFSDQKIFWMIVSESVLLCVVAALLGLGLAWRILPMAAKFLNSAPISMPSSVVAIGVMLALILAIVSAIAPASRGRRLQVAEALAGR